MLTKYGKRRWSIQWVLGINSLVIGHGVTNLILQNWTRDYSVGAKLQGHTRQAIFEDAQNIQKMIGLSRVLQLLDYTRYCFGNIFIICIFFNANPNIQFINEEKEVNEFPEESYCIFTIKFNSIMVQNNFQSGEPDTLQPNY